MCFDVSIVYQQQNSTILSHHGEDYHAKHVGNMHFSGFSEQSIVLIWYLFKIITTNYQLRINSSEWSTLDQAAFQLISSIMLWISFPGNMKKWCDISLCFLCCLKNTRKCLEGPVKVEKDTPVNVVTTAFNVRYFLSPPWPLPRGSNKQTSFLSLSAARKLILCIITDQVLLKTVWSIFTTFICSLIFVLAE